MDPAVALASRAFGSPSLRCPEVDSLPSRQHAASPQATPHLRMKPVSRHALQPPLRVACRRPAARPQDTPPPCAQRNQRAALPCGPAANASPVTESRLSTSAIGTEKPLKPGAHPSCSGRAARPPFAIQERLPLTRGVLPRSGFQLAQDELRRAASSRRNRSRMRSAPSLL